MPVERLDPEAVFTAARQAPPDDRAAFLDRACAGDPALRQRVERLLAVHARIGSFLESPAPELDPTRELPALGEQPGTVIGPYKLLEPIGEGGFGVVFMAEQTHPLRRKVALKVVKPGMDTRQVVARFEAERQALALMDHPNIAKVFDAGTTDLGRPYFVMELVRGIPITQFCDDKRLTARERLGLFISACQAIQHAHQKGIIHRDLKPSNVLVTLHDGVPVPKVIDFGVAKALGQQLTEKTLFTGFAQLVGTPLYMSPEQAEMSGLDADTRTDIYSLGVLLYELLTGTTPLDKDRLGRVGYDELRRIIREEEPPRPSTRISTLAAAADTVSTNRQSDPRRLSRLVRGELDWVVMKALEKDRNRRYESAAALAADVRRYLHDEPVQACPPSAMYRFRKLARRNRRSLAMASALALAAFVGVGALAVSTARVWRADQDVWKANQELKAAVDDERSEAYFQRITAAYGELSNDHLGRALKLLDDCPGDLRAWEWHYLMRLCRAEELVIRDTTEVHGVAFSRDGDLLASAGGDGTIKIWSSTGKRIRTIHAHSDTVVSVAFHPDGKHVASRSADQVKVWDWTAPDEPVWTVPCDAVRKFGTAYTVAFSPDGRLLAAGIGTDGVVRVWDWTNHQLVHDLPGHNFHSIPVVFSGDGRLATGAAGEGLKLWDPETGKLIRTVPAVIGPVSGLAFSADGKWLASASYDRTVKLWDSTTGELFRDLLHPGNQVECVAISPDGRRLASGCEDKTVRIWDTATGREVLVLRGHKGRCGCVAFSPDGHRLASASFDKTIRIWDGTPLRGDEPGQEMSTFTGHSNELRVVAFSPDGTDGLRVASGGNDGLVSVWDAQTHRVSAEFRDHLDKGGTKAVFCVAWHPKGQHIASGSNDALRVWNARTEVEVFSPLLAAPKKIGLGYSAVTFSPDGSYLVTGTLRGVVQVWDGDTGQPVGKNNVLYTHNREVWGLVFSRDRKHLASASADGIVKLWDAKRLNEEQKPRDIPGARIPGPGVNVAFSPDGRRLALGGEENTVKIWDLENERELHTLRGHHGDVYTLAFSPDGRWIASGGEDSSVKVWDARNDYRLVRSFRGHKGLVSSLAFSPDGRLLVSGSRDYTVKVWYVSKLHEEPER